MLDGKGQSLAYELLGDVNALRVTNQFVIKMQKCTMWWEKPLKNQEPRGWSLARLSWKSPNWHIFPCSCVCCITSTLPGLVLTNMAATWVLMAPAKEISVVWTLFFFFFSSAFVAEWSTTLTAFLWEKICFHLTPGKWKRYFSFVAAHCSVSCFATGPRCESSFERKPPS